MWNRLKLVFCAAFLGATVNAPGFSLLGPYAPWQTQTLGYQLPFDIGGPQNLGEEYRITLPVIFYAYDESFLNFFGEEGTRAVDSAFLLVNRLPRVSKFSDDLSEFPLDTRRFNYQAAALGLIDLQSQALACIVEQMGLAGAERYVWTLRNRIAGPPPIYTVIKRNFDPITWEPTSYVNGTLYTYQIVQFGGNRWEAVEISVDPFAPSVTSVSIQNGLGGGATDAAGTSVTFAPGMFYTGLTRDDAGGLRYIYHTLNLNVEDLLPEAIGGSSSPYSPYGTGVTNTNATTAGAVPAGGGGGRFGNSGRYAASDFYAPFPGGTNTTATNFVVRGLRPGIEKILFVRVNYDSRLGGWTAFTNSYNDRFVTNRTFVNQTFQRPITQPDLLIGAEDLGVDPGGFQFLLTRTANFVNNDAINGSTTLNGPGINTPQMRFIFGKMVPANVNSGETDETVGTPDSIWGSFDGSTNPPVVYPNHLSIRELEARALGRRPRR